MMKKLFSILLVALSLIPFCFAQNKKTDSLPFDNKYYFYDNGKKIVDSFAFFDGELYYNGVAGEYFVEKIYFDKKTSTFSFIEDGDKYFNDKKNDSFSLIEDGKPDSEWVLTKDKDFSEEEIEELKAWKYFLKGFSEAF